MIHYCLLDTPIGPLLLAADERHLKHVLLPHEGQAPKPDAGWERSSTPVLDRAAAQLEAYFNGELEEFDLPLAPDGTPFQQEVWDALLAIPYGETRSYAEVAHVIGRPNAFRAVGAANGRNPISVIIPCHRVIGSDGDLTGFGGGLDAKRTLLDLERGVDDRRQHTLFP